MKKFRTGIVIGSAALLVACSGGDTLAPPPVIEGYDLALRVSAAAPDKGTDPVTHLPIASPTAMRVDYTIRNRGNRPAPAHLLMLHAGVETYRGIVFSTHQYASIVDTLPIPDIDAGDSIHGTAIIRSNRTYLFSYDENATSDSIVAFGRLVLPDQLDADSTNNKSTSPPFYVAVGILHITGALLPFSKMHTLEPFPVSITASNIGRHGTASGVSLRLCMYDFDYGCVPFFFAPFGRYDLPDIAPLGAFTANYMTSIAPSASYQSGAARFSFAVCSAPSAWNDPYLLDGYNGVVPPGEMQPQGCLLGLGNVTVRPDIQAACNPPMLSPGQTITLTAKNCGIRPPTTQATTIARTVINDEIAKEQFYAFAFRGVAGKTYAIPKGYSQIVDTDGETFGVEPTGTANQFRITRTGTYFINAGSKNSVTLIEQ